MNWVTLTLFQFTAENSCRIIKDTAIIPRQKTSITLLLTSFSRPYFLVWNMMIYVKRRYIPSGIATKIKA